MSRRTLAKLYLLGTFKLLVDAPPREMDLPSQKARWVLAYLAAKAPHPQPRSRIAGILWPDMPESGARRALNQAVWQVRRRLGRDALVSKGENLMLGDSVWVDVVAFRRSLEAGDTGSLLEALSLYKGDFLPECYQDWALVERERLRDLYLRALEQVSRAMRVEGDYDRAAAFLREIIRLDPLREDAHRDLIQLYLILDRPAEAMRQYGALRTLLLEELGVEPSADLRSLRKTIERHLQADDSAGPAPIFTTQPRLPLIGRRREREALLHGVEQAMRGHGALLLVEGRQGMGKSRLLADAREGALWRGMQVGYGQAEETITPYSPLREAVDSLLSPSCLSGLRTRVSKPLLDAASNVWPSLGSPSGEVRQRQLRQAMARIIVELSRCMPLAFFLDDMHDADTAVFDILDELLPHLEELPIFIALAYRPLDARSREDLWERLLALDREAAPQRVFLSPFDDEEQRAFIAAALNISPDMPVTEELSRVCGHTPLYIVEVLRYLRRRGMLARTPEGGWVLDGKIDALPPTVHSLVQQRARRLPAPARDLLTTLSVFGEKIPSKMLQEITALYTPNAPALLYDLARYGFLIHESGTYRFSHALVRDAVYESIPVGKRRSIHRRLAHLWLQQEQISWESVAHHAEEGGEVPLAIHAHLQAAREAMGVHAYERAVFHSESALRLSSPKDAVRCDLWLVQGEAYSMMGQVEASRRSLASALLLSRYLRNPVRLAQACLKTGELAIRQSRYVQARRFLLRARRLFGKLGAKQEVAKSLVYITDVERSIGDLDSALNYAETAVKLTTGQPWERERMLALSRWAAVSALRGDLDEAARGYEQVAKLASETGDHYTEGFAINGLGVLALTTREPLKAQRHFSQAMQIAEQLEDRYNVTVSRLNLAVAASDAGHLGEAMQLGVSALEEARATGNRRTEVLALFLLSDILSCWGDFEAAIARLEKGEKLALDTNYVEGQVFAICHWSSWYWKRGDMDAAARWGKQCVMSIRDKKMNGKLPMAAYRYALALLDAGNPEASVEVLTEGLGHAQAQRPRAILEASLARALADAGRDEDALRFLHRAVSVLGQMHEDEYLPQAWYDIALAAGKVEPSLAREALRSAYIALQSICLHVPEEHHAGFLHGVAPHRRISQAWQRQAPRPIERLRIRLPAADGRGTVSVVWTVDAGDDDVIVEATRGPMALRRHRLERLLREAERSGARATHKALADALGVSVSTVRRDLKALDTEG